MNNETFNVETAAVGTVITGTSPRGDWKMEVVEEKVGAEFGEFARTVTKVRAEICGQTATFKLAKAAAMLTQPQLTITEIQEG